ncbi:delta-lactam-biosynthetic de-N-acetylase [Amphibacillus cookii]|uniref:delta-lactam-biosynthetic de-N-acetylase n=1 Tax=Amphibacillus cookii TaxID=767787 RepID=UPI001959751C|nr:delta-lactam-biosynthetic de-N-acetylase [Amphibacillus cookii]MBM7542120.1 peptidoglycan-N-acetylmuramic acid deacetylase [Amphibacillus cookii]
MKKWVLVTLIMTVINFMLPQSIYAYGWGFKKGHDHQPPDVGTYGDLLKQYGGYYIDDSEEKNIYLTFDNGYEAGYTAGILDVLQEEQVPATFFVTGHYVRSEPELIKRMVAEGHLLGNHSYHHPDSTGLTKPDFEKELTDLDRAVEKITGIDKLQYFRPPGGTFNEDTIKWASELGYIHVFWSLAFVDWHSEQKKGWESAYQQVEKQLHPGAIILLHTVSEDNAKALVHMIKTFREQGYTFKSLDDLVIQDYLPDPLNH